MNKIRTLLEEYWICRETDKEEYYSIKRDIPKFQRFVREQLGWRLIHNEHVLKLEKVPAHAEIFMGILEFTELRDYCILCTILMFLEDKEEQEQFLLSELIDFVGAQMRSLLEVDWNSFSQRKSLVRVLQFAEKRGMLKVYEGSSEAFGQSAGQEVLYENTGISRYFATNFSFDISGFSSYRDFEREPLEDLETERGHFRINRVYRQLALCPAMYWENNEDADSLYLKNQRQWVSRYLSEQLGGRLDIHKNAAFWLLSEDDCYGMVHPRDAMLPELVLLICAQLRKMTEDGTLAPDRDEMIRLPESKFSQLAAACREGFLEAWSKEYREMDLKKIEKAVRDYMKQWLLLKEEGEMLCICPGAVKFTGFYPKDYLDPGRKDKAKAGEHGGTQV